ncbi:AMP-binding protein [Lentzea sp. NPDC042327]|uniref:AMP-binding protein n=1 Tax=Lentzea sp. NPDC042327 TaxID=3154801 RepID=UPI0033EE8DB5
MTTFAHNLVGGLAGSTAAAVVEQGVVTTHAQLLSQAREVAIHLRRRGAEPGAVVPIQAAPSTTALVQVVAILMTGAAFAPIDLRMPPRTAARIARLCGADFILGAAGGTTDGVVRLSPRDLAGDPGPHRLIPTVPRDTSYMIFTSGTSGEPKGVVVPESAVTAYLGWSMREYDCTRGWGAPLFTSLGFDLTITSLLGPLLNGRRVEVLDPLRWPLHVANDPGILQGASFVKMTPSQVTVLCELLEARGARCSIPVLVVGGEALYGPGVARWRESLPDTLVVNEYGPSEATVGCCRYTVPADCTSHEIPIGTAPPGVELSIEGPPSPTGDGFEEGELVITGVQVATGYLTASEAEAGDVTARGRLRPFPGPPGKRSYRSGDRVRRDHDGTYTYLGRLGREAKVAGFRINLAALESRLNAFPGVVSAAVQADEVHGLRSAVVTRDGGTTQEDLLAHLRETFPSYALPSSIRISTQVSTTERGKSSVSWE